MGLHTCPERLAPPGVPGSSNPSLQRRPGADAARAGPRTVQKRLRAGHAMAAVAGPAGPARCPAVAALARSPTVAAPGQPYTTLTYALPMSREYANYKTVKPRFWPRLSH